MFAMLMLLRKNLILPKHAVFRICILSYLDNIYIGQYLQYIEKKSSLLKG
jgi:hypothetical protein